MDLINGNNQNYWFVHGDGTNNVQRVNDFNLQAVQVTNTESNQFILDSEIQQYIQTSQPIPIAVLPNKTNEPNHGTVNLNTHISKYKQLWTPQRTQLLLQLTTKKGIQDLNKGNKIWSEISNSIGLSPEQCAKMYSTLRNIYIRLSNKKRMGAQIKWSYYKLCEDTFKDCNTLPEIETWEHEKIYSLLSLYAEKVPLLKTSQITHHELWKSIALQLNSTEYRCYNKFRFIKRTYDRCIVRKALNKLIKWPFFSLCERLFTGHDKSPWDKRKIKLLLNSYGEFIREFKMAMCNKKLLWTKVAEIVGEPAHECDRKFRNLKQTYNNLKSKGDSRQKWCYFSYFESFNNLNAIKEKSNTLTVNSDNIKICTLLNFVIENKDKFDNTLLKKRNLWREISKKLGMGTEECYKKYRSLKQTYIRISQKKKLTGKTSEWPYYSYFERIYGQMEFKAPKYIDKDIDKVLKDEIQKVVSDITANKEMDDKFQKLLLALKESNDIQRERNLLLKSLIDNR